MNPSQQQLERIVAYLDGELSAEESALVEQQLAADEQFRQELQGAQRAWTALDELPMAAVGDDFSHTTMAMVVDVARQDVQSQTIALPVQQRKRKTTTAVLATMAVLLGALVFRVLWNNPNRRLLADLPVIQNVDIYSQFHKVEFLQQLHRQLGKGQEISTSEVEQLRAKSVEFQQVSTDDSREAWLEYLSDDEKIVLRAKLNRFRNLSPQRQTEMRQLHQQLHSENDREPLLETMFRYQQFLSELPQSEQYAYRELSASDRAIRVAREMEQAANAQKFELTPEQLQRLFRRVRPHIQKVVKQNQKVFKQELAKMSSRDQRFFREKAKPEQVMWAFQFAMRHTQGRVEMMETLNDVVVNALPVEMQEPFQQLPFWEKSDLMRSWFWQARSQAASARRPEGKRRPGKISEQEFADFFLELRPEEKEQLLALSREQMQQRLEGMMRGKMRPRDRRGPAQWGDHPPPLHGPPHEGRGRGRLEDRRRPGPPPRGPRRGPGFEGERSRRPPRDFERDGPRRRPPEESSSSEE